ncbi:MAG: hypothetical protein JNJ60_06780 [Rhodocyclaceae bacterium]|nr:hypothetical protein [Rhodocyclaceae bacterium]
MLLACARLDNRIRLLAETGLHDAPAVDDCALIEAMLARTGEDGVAHLAGDFVFAHWDPERARLLLARDAQGARALYYFHHDGVFAFCTQIRALLALPCVSSVLREETLARNLNGQSAGAGWTCYEQIRVLPAAHLLSFAASRSHLRQYWMPQACPAVFHAQHEGYARDLRQRVTAAVESRLRNGQKIAVHLSGGLDSSAIACLAARALKRQGRRLVALCSVLPEDYRGPESDEKQYMRAVLAQEGNIDAVWIESALDLPVFGDLPRVFRILGQPTYSNISHIDMALGEAGRAQGVDVVLSGVGGDLFASARGDCSVRELLVQGKWAYAVSELLALRKTQSRSIAGLMRAEVLRPMLQKILRKWLIERRGKTCLTPELRRRMRTEPGQPQPIGYSSFLGTSVREAMRMLATPGVLDQVLTSQLDIFALEFGQHLTFPLLDRYVIEFMLGLPDEQFRLGGWPRGIFRRAMQGIIPESIRMRREKGAAFDPAISSRVVAQKDMLADWATADRPCWRFVDRAAYLAALAQVQRAERSKWQQEMFSIVLRGGAVAHFVDWHYRHYGESLVCRAPT